MKKPVIFDYLDLLSFLRDYFSYRKQAEPGFSYESWASELKFQSRSYVRMILLGKKKVSLNFAEYFADATKMTPKEKEFLLALLKYSQAGQSQERQIFGEKLIQILRTVADRKSIDAPVEFVSKTLYSRLLTLLSFQDLQKTDSSLAKLLDLPNIEVFKALEVLQGLGLAEVQDIEGVKLWSTTFKKFTVPAQVGSKELMRYHEQSLQEAIGAFPMAKDLRFYKSLVLPLSPEELGKFRELLENFSSEQLTRFQSSVYGERRLFQVNLNYYAVTQNRDETHPA